MEAKDIKLFKGLNESQIKKLLSYAKEIKIPAGEIIIQEGEKGSTLYILKEGTVEILKTVSLKIGESTSRDRARRLARLRAEDGVFFGEMAFMGEEERSATVKAVTDCVVLTIEKGDFDKLAEEDCSLGFTVVKNIAEILSHRLKQANEDIAKLTTALSIAISIHRK